MRGFKTGTKVLVGLLVVGLLLGTTSVAWAEPAAPANRRLPRRFVLRGEVTAIEGTTLTVETHRGEVSVLTDDETRFRIPGSDEPGLDDLAKGARVLVGGLRTEEGDLLARIVARLPLPPSRRRVVGQIAAADGEELTLTLRSGHEISLVTDEKTRFLVPGVPEATLADLNVGDTVAAQGSRSQEDEPPYAAVVVVLRDAEGHPAALRGELTAINGSTLTVKLGSGDEVRLQTDGHTRFMLRGVPDATLADLNVGDIIGAQVTEGEDGALYASAIGRGQVRLRPRRGIVRGRISAVEGDTITLSTRRGRVIVRTDEHTRFRLPGIEEPGIDDLEAGQMAGAAGRWNEDGSFQARIVGARTGRSDMPVGGSSQP